MWRLDRGIEMRRAIQVSTGLALCLASGCATAPQKLSAADHVCSESLTGSRLCDNSERITSGNLDPGMNYRTFDGLHR